MSKYIKVLTGNKSKTAGRKSIDLKRKIIALFWCIAQANGSKLR